MSFLFESVQKLFHPFRKAEQLSSPYISQREIWTDSTFQTIQLTKTERASYQAKGLEMHARSSQGDKEYQPYERIEENGSERSLSCYKFRESVIANFRSQASSHEDFVHNLFGVHNVIWVLFSLSLLRWLLFVHSMFLITSIRDAPKVLVVFGLIWACCYLFPAAYYLKIKFRVLSVGFYDILFRCLLVLMWIVPCRWVTHRQYPIVPSFSVAAQTTCFFLKMHAFLSVIETEQRKGKSLGKLISWRNFSYFLVAPTFVYRVKGIRWKYFFILVVQCCGLLVVMYLIMTEYMLPLFKKASSVHSLEFIVNLIVPCGVFYLLFFVLIFEVMLNGFAELSRYGDRLFYEDWWNAISHDEFLRKWNRPIYKYLVTIVYRNCLRKNLEKWEAMTRTFAYSSVLHEIILAISFRRLRLYLMVLMMLQTPLIWFMNQWLKIQQRSLIYRRLSNVFFWTYIFLGPTLLMLVYSREYVGENVNC
eukprot:jgi/Galph1/5952/GphlegSOOS_G4622.1